MKQSLKTGDARIAKARAAEVNAKYEEVLAKARAGQAVERPAPVVVAPPVFSSVVLVGRRTVKELACTYLDRRSRELQHGGFKSVRFSVGLFVSAYGTRQIGAITRDDALAFVRKVALLGCHAGKSWRTRGFGLDQLIQASRGECISARTQRRTVSQVGHFLDWAVYEGELMVNPFKTVRVEAKGKNRSYAALTNVEVGKLVGLEDARINDVLLFCLLTGMRAGEAVGLVREDSVWKGRRRSLFHTVTRLDKSLVREYPKVSYHAENIIKNIITLAALCAIVTAYGPVETSEPTVPGQPIALSSSDVKVVQAGVRSSMKDPESARFGSMAAARDSKGTVTVCGYVNGRNSFGGYTGEKPFTGILAQGANGKAYSVVGIGGSESEVLAAKIICKRKGSAI